MASAIILQEFLDGEGVILDVRSPAEYQHARIPGAVNLPLFSDAERARIGTLYKQMGQEKAIEEGLRCVGPKLLELVHEAKRLAGGVTRVHCWRGGMRSRSVAWLLETAGLSSVTLDGGYKSFRRYVGRVFESQPAQLLVLGGMTGSGKTEILQALAAQGEQVLDLEALARHRGSSYGMLGMAAQPSNEQFENEIACRWREFDKQRPIWVEDESHLIGCCKIPDALFHIMRQAPVITVQKPIEERIESLCAVYGTAPPDHLIAATRRIGRRLGGQRLQEVISAIEQGGVASAISLVLEYYDRAYSFGLRDRPGGIFPSVGEGWSVGQWAQQVVDVSKVALEGR